MAQYGTGSDFQKAAQAVTGLLQGLAGDNLAGALANASSPYLATLIKQQVGEDNKAANAMAHAVLGAVVAELNNQSAAAGGLGAGGGELSAHVILNTLFPGKEIWELSESEKQQVSALSQLASGLAGGLTTGDVAGAITGSQAAKNAVENNALSDLVEAQAAGKTPQKVAEERVNAEIERYKKENCAGMSAGACSAKMAEDRDKFFREAASLGIDFVPVVGDFKSFAEADDWIDYTLAAAGTLPFAKVFTKPLKEAKLLLKAGDLDGANKLIKEASDAIPTKSPSNPTSQSSSGAWKPDHGVEVNTGAGKQKDLESSSQPPQNTGSNHQRPPRNAANLAGDSLERAQQVSGRFQIENGPKNGTVYRADNQGNITSYATYDSNGMILKRVDVTGAAHGGIATPHVIEYGRNVLPNGQVRVQSPSTKALPRPVREDEIP
ncbi:polymorphic toxin type 24 domain-containing protein [Providencia huaxiensis]